ncbi:unnamed protein product [Brassica oleracea var. botrytis]|uniref:(rape) hypothetical protein n=1 Tax=Brassica napus TaxID=3708 RepID=A0A816UDF0_BRANA|nr:unnamed protein product [Brassica napus]
MEDIGADKRSRGREMLLEKTQQGWKEWKRYMVQSRLDAPDDLHLPLLPLQRVIIWLSNEEEFWSAFEDESAIWFATALKDEVIDTGHELHSGDSQVRGYPFKVVQNHASVVINRAINIFSSRGINPQRRSGSRKQPSQLSTVVNEPSLPPPNTDPSPESLGAAASRPLRQGWVQRKLRRLGYSQWSWTISFQRITLWAREKYNGQLEARIGMERTRREFLCSSSLALKMHSSVDATNDGESVVYEEEKVQPESRSSFTFKERFTAESNIERRSN